MKLDPYNRNHFQKWFRQKLLYNDVTMKSLADQLSFNYSTVQKWKRSGHHPNKTVLRKLVLFFEVREQVLIQAKIKILNDQIDRIRPLADSVGIDIVLKKKRKNTN